MSLPTKPLREAVQRSYGASMASGYNGRLLPAQAVIERGELRLSRRRETLEDAVSRDVPG